MSAHQSIVVVGSFDGIIHALSGQDGSLLWQDATGHSFGGPAMAIQDGMLYTASPDGQVYAFSLADGMRRWQQTLTTDLQFADRVREIRLAVAGDLVAVGCSTNRDAFIATFQAQHGAARWRHQVSVFSPLSLLLGLDRNAVYITEIHASSSPRFYTRALRATDGTIRWSRSDYYISPPSQQAAVQLALGEGVVYGYNSKAGLLALDAATGALLWEQPAAVDDSYGQLAIDAAVLYLATCNRFGAYRRQDGALVWQVGVQREPGGYAEAFTQVVALGGTVCVGRSSVNPQSFQIEGWEPRTGILRWIWPGESRQLPPDISWRFTGAHGVLYVPAHEALHAVRGSDGQELWSTAIPHIGLLVAAS
jgi:outer membrane protein assembly factor BamB